MTSNISDRKLFIQRIAKVCEMLDQLQMQGRSITGRAKSDSDYDVIRKILDNLKESDEFLDPEYLSNNNIKFQKTSDVFYNFEKLLNNSLYRRQIPASNFYLVEPGQAFFFNEDNIYFHKYLNILKLYNFFEKKSDHISNDLGKYNLIFLGKEKLLITDEYSFEDLIEIKNIDVFISKFSTNESDRGVSSKEKNQILKKSLVNFFKGCEKINFSQIIQDFNNLSRYIDDELDIYMSKFSYEDIKNEVEKEKVDFTIRLNNIFSDIQTQLIGVPVSVILAADKLKIGSEALKDTNKFFGMSLTNLLVILAISFYAIVLAMLIRNQCNSLLALKDEIDHHESLFNSKHKGMAQKFKKSFLQIKNRYEHQKKMLLWVDILVCIAFGAIYIIAYTSSVSNLEILLPIMALSLIIGIIFYYYQYE